MHSDEGGYRLGPQRTFRRGFVGCTGLQPGVFDVCNSKPRSAGSTQGCGITKCATTVRTRITGTARTTLRYMPPSQVLARDGRSNSPMMTVASSATRMPALISDARTGSKCGGHIAERLTAHPQLGKTGCATQRTNKPRRTTQAAITGERVALRV